MKRLPWILGVLLATAGCPSTPALSPSHAAALSDSVRTFMHTIAHDVTAQGPAGWRAQLVVDSTFFMAVNGRLEFASGEAAQRTVDQLIAIIPRLALSWSDSVRIDPLRPGLAAVGVAYHELRVDTAGHHVEESGFFTGLAEHTALGWRLRNAHWSLIAPTATVP